MIPNLERPFAGDIDFESHPSPGLKSAILGGELSFIHCGVLSPPLSLPFESGPFSREPHPTDEWGWAVACWQETMPDFDSTCQCADNLYGSFEEVEVHGEGKRERELEGI